LQDELMTFYLKMDSNFFEEALELFSYFFKYSSFETQNIIDLLKKKVNLNEEYQIKKFLGAYSRNFSKFFCKKMKDYDDVEIKNRITEYFEKFFFSENMHLVIYHNSLKLLNRLDRIFGAIPQKLTEDKFQNLSRNKHIRLNLHDQYNNSNHLNCLWGNQIKILEKLYKDKLNKNHIDYNDINYNQKNIYTTPYLKYSETIYDVFDHPIINYTLLERFIFFEHKETVEKLIILIQMPNRNFFYGSSLKYFLKYAFFDKQQLPLIEKLKLKNLADQIEIDDDCIFLENLIKIKFYLTQNGVKNIELLVETFNYHLNCLFFEIEGFLDFYNENIINKCPDCFSFEMVFEALQNMHYFSNFECNFHDMENNSEIRNKDLKYEFYIQVINDFIYCLKNKENRFYLILVKNVEENKIKKTIKSNYFNLKIDLNNLKKFEFYENDLIEDDELDAKYIFGQKMKFFEFQLDKIIQKSNYKIHYVNYKNYNILESKVAILFKIRSENIEHLYFYILLFECVKLNFISEKMFDRFNNSNKIDIEISEYGFEILFQGDCSKLVHTMKRFFNLLQHLNIDLLKKTEIKKQEMYSVEKFFLIDKFLNFIKYKNILQQKNDFDFKFKQKSFSKMIDFSNVKFHFYICTSYDHLSFDNSIKHIFKILDSKFTNNTNNYTINVVNEEVFELKEKKTIFIYTKADSLNPSCIANQILKREIILDISKKRKEEILGTDFICINDIYKTKNCDLHICFYGFDKTGEEINFFVTLFVELFNLNLTYLSVDDFEVLKEKTLTKFRKLHEIIPENFEILKNLSYMNLNHQEYVDTVCNCINKFDLKDLNMLYKDFEFINENFWSNTSYSLKKI
ncbi:hypothetical protein GVAV_002583, partial [Gurleya vavrai]